MGYAVWVVDRRLSVWFANRAAGDAEGLEEIWTGWDAGAGADFKRRTAACDLILSACDGESASNTVETREGHRWSFFAQPLRVEPDRSLALLSGRRIFQSSIDAAKLQALFGLSPGQARVCEHLATGATFAVVGRRMDISVSTARTHFKEALARIGVTNLRQLLALIASLPQTVDR